MKMTFPDRETWITSTLIALAALGWIAAYNLAIENDHLREQIECAEKEKNR